MTESSPLAQDLDYVLERTRDFWEELRGKRVLITGGTGFFGCWLLESFLWANRQLGLRAEAVVLSRNPEAFSKKLPHLAMAPEVRWLKGDVRTFSAENVSVSHVIHAATDVDPARRQQAEGQLYESIVSGTEHALDVSKLCGAEKFLYISSGAVYRRDGAGGGAFSEACDTSSEAGAEQQNPYAEGKRAAERLCLERSEACGLELKIARCFAFLGPYLPLDGGFAVTDFLRSALGGQALKISGNKKVLRSYLYGADLAVWLWTILFRGRADYSYNVGSDQAIELLELAKLVARVSGRNCEVLDVRSEAQMQELDSYWPSVERARNELGLDEWLPLDEALRRTVEYYQGMCRP